MQSTYYAVMLNGVKDDNNRHHRMGFPQEKGTQNDIIRCTF